MTSSTTGGEAAAPVSGVYVPLREKSPCTVRIRQSDQLAGSFVRAGLEFLRAWQGARPAPETAVFVGQLVISGESSTRRQAVNPGEPSREFVTVLLDSAGSFVSAWGVLPPAAVCGRLLPPLQGSYSEGRGFVPGTPEAAVRVSRKGSCAWGLRSFPVSVVKAATYRMVVLFHISNQKGVTLVPLIVAALASVKDLESWKAAEGSESPETGNLSGTLWSHGAPNVSLGDMQLNLNNRETRMMLRQVEEARGLPALFPDVVP